MDYTLIRSKRKTLTVRILPSGTVEVRAPLRLSRGKIEQFLAEKADWIAAAQSQCAALPARLAEGTRLPYLGEFYPLRLREHLPPGPREGKLPPPLSPFAGDAEIRAAAETFYRAEAKKLLPPLIERLAGQLGVECRGLRVTGAKTRWGSCSAKASLNFSWRLMAAPPEEIELVVAHELCHLLHFNHSPAFYAALAGILPDWKARTERLRDYRQLCW